MKKIYLLSILLCSVMPVLGATGITPFIEEKAGSSESFAPSSILESKPSEDSEDSEFSSKLRAFGGDGEQDGFTDTGATDNNSGYNDPNPVLPLNDGTLFLTILLVVYVLLKKKIFVFYRLFSKKTNIYFLAYSFSGITDSINYIKFSFFGKKNFCS